MNARNTTAEPEWLAGQMRQKPHPARSHAELMDKLKLEFEPEIEPWLIDLSQGCWRPREAASQLAGQLQTALPHQSQAIKPAGTPKLVGAGVDAEARGPLGAASARPDADLLLGLLREQTQGPLLVIVWVDHPLASDDDSVWLLHFLESDLPAFAGRLLLVRPADDALPASGLPSGTPPRQALPPGLHGTKPADARPSEWHPLRGQQWLQCPVARRRSTPPGRSAFDRLAHADGINRWVQAYAWFFGSNHFVDSAALAETGWQAHLEGANALSLTLLQRASDCAPHRHQKAALLARMQGIRIATQRWAAAAGQPLPSGELPPALHQFLRHSIGWGRVMQGQLDGLDAFLGADRAGDALQGSDLLYALNIRALGLARSGRLDEALALELDIERRRRAETIDDARLAYVNSLNIARLLRQRDDFSGSQRYYEEAFATQHGVRFPTESLHRDWIRSGLARAQGQARLAGLHLLQAALHWMAAPTPDALPLRVAQAVLGATLPELSQRANAVDTRLLKALERAVTHGELPPPGQARIELQRPALAPLPSGRLMGLPGLSIRLIPKVDAGRAHPSDSARDVLADLLGRLLCALLPLAAWASSHAVVIDDAHGRDVPSDLATSLCLALLRECEVLVWEGRSIDITPAARPARKHLRVRLGRAVQTLERLADGRVQLHYRRHREPHTGSLELAALLNRIDAGPGRCVDVQNLPRWTDTPELGWKGIQQAWQIGAVDIEPLSDICTTVGIS